MPAIIQGNLFNYAVDAEASDTYVISLTPNISAYVDGAIYSFDANTANTGAATLNIDTIGAKAIVKHGGDALENNDIKAGQRVVVQYNSTDDDFEMVSHLGNIPGVVSSNHVFTDYANGSDYTTTSTSFVDTDATNLKTTLTTIGGDVLHIIKYTSGATVEFYVDLHDGSARLTANTWGMGASPDRVDVSGVLFFLETGLAAAAHTWTLQWASSGGTAIMNSKTTETTVSILSMEL